MNRVIQAAVAGLVLILLAYSICYIVDQRQIAIVFSWGEAKEIVSEPGLHFKLPPPFQNVRYFDNRIMTLESSETDHFITAEKMNISVDAFAKWRINDAKRFFVSFSGDEARARDRLSQLMKAALNDEITKHNVADVIAGDRNKIMEAIHLKMASEAASVGIKVVDVRIKRVEYLEQINDAVFERMKSERTKVANDKRSQGFGEAENIRAKANLDRTVILSEAYRQAEKIRGDGDAQASRIYAEAFGQNPEFYKFYRSLEAYRASFKSRGDLIVVDPNSEFFKYFKSPGGANSK